MYPRKEQYRKKTEQRKKETEKLSKNENSASKRIMVEVYSKHRLLPGYRDKLW